MVSSAIALPMTPAVSPDQIQEAGGWRTWPWVTILFLHCVFLLANITPGEILFPVDEVADVGRAITASDQGMMSRRIAFLVLGAVAAYAFVRFDYRKYRINGVLGVLMLAFFTWSCLSWSWADDSALVIRKLVIFVLLWLGAGWAAIRLPPRDLLRFAFVSNMLTLFTCLGLELAFGRFGTARFAGIYHPNETGQCLAVGVVAALALASRAPFRVALGYVLAAGLSFYLLLLTGSRTSLMTVACAAAVYWLVLSFANTRAARILLITCGIVTVAACIGYLLMGSDFGKDIFSAVALGRQDSDITTLTERTPLWHVLIGRYISARPFLGYGYEAFWDTKHLIAMSLLRRGIVYFHSHSGYLEMALSIGVIGAAVHVLTIVWSALKLAGEYLRSCNEGSAFGAAILVTLLFSMFTEPMNMSVYLTPTFIDMVFLMYCAFVMRPEAARVTQPSLVPAPRNLLSVSL